LGERVANVDGVSRERALLICPLPPSRCSGTLSRKRERGKKVGK
jgi:hypothetical protein